MGGRTDREPERRRGGWLAGAQRPPAEIDLSIPPRGFDSFSVSRDCRSILASAEFANSMQNETKVSYGLYSYDIFVTAY